MRTEGWNGCRYNWSCIGGYIRGKIRSNRGGCNSDLRGSIGDVGDCSSQSSWDSGRVVSVWGKWGKGCRGDGTIIDETCGQSNLGISLTFVETIHMGVAVSGTTISVSGSTVISSVPKISISKSPITAVMRMAIKTAVQVCWIGFRLSQSKGG